MNIKDAKVLVTGGTSGIGLETALMLKNAGAAVFICGRDVDKLKEAMQLTGAEGMPADMSKEEDIIELVKTAKSKLGGLNVLVNNAGIGTFAALTETTAEDFTKVWQTNVFGAMIAAREAAKIFKEQSNGNIVNIASTAGSKGFANGSAYCSTKFALTGLTECWRAELRKNNVRVMQVNPSEVVTHFAGNEPGKKPNEETKLHPIEIAHTIVSMLQMNDVGFITDATVWATNPV